MVRLRSLRRSALSLALAGLTTSALATEAPASPEFDLNLEEEVSLDLDLGLGSGLEGRLTSFAQDWKQARAAEGKPYEVAVGTAIIQGNQGEGLYVDAYAAALKAAILSAHAEYVSQVANNTVASNLDLSKFQRDGFDPADAEAECKQSDAQRMASKLRQATNALANKAIEMLGETPDYSTDLETAVRCEFDLLSERLSSAASRSAQMALRGGRVLRQESEGNTVGVVIAYGQPGVELADVVRAQRMPSAINPDAVQEIRGWVESNMLSHPEILDLVGIRSFKLSNGEWALVSLGIAGLPHNISQMSSRARQMRAANAMDRADLAAMAQIQEFAGVAVKDNITDDVIAEFVESMNTEIQDGVVTATSERTKVQTIMARELSSRSKGELRGATVIQQNGRNSPKAGLPVAYTIRAWSPSLLGAARNASAVQSRSAPPSQQPARQEAKQPPRGSASPVMQEDW